MTAASAQSMFGAPSPFRSLRTEHLFGLDLVAEATIEEVVAWLLANCGNGRPRWEFVVTPNVDHLVRYDRLPRERAIASSAILALPDGMPIVWVSRRVGRDLRRRLAGSDLFMALWPALARDGVAALALAPDQGVADGLTAAHPGASVVIPPVFDIADEAATEGVVERLVDDVVRRRPAFVMLFVSVAKTHLLAERLAESRLPPGQPYPTIMLLGASAEFFVGRRKRAPQWISTVGLEWVYRLALEPRRLAKRYLIDDALFVKLAWREWRIRPARVGRSD